MKGVNDLSTDSLSAGSGPIDPPGLRAWTFLFAALAVAAGHGAFLLASVLDVWSDLRGAGPFERLQDAAGGRQPRLGALAMLWLMGAPLLALAGLALRRALMRSRLVVPLAAGATLATAAVFAIYLTNTVRG